MNCPDCKHPMTEQPLQGRRGEKVIVDVCHGCRGLWFDGHESLQLSAQGTLRLFSEMHSHRAERRPHPQRVLPCPRCDGKLRPAQRLVREQRFHASRCAQGHGHFITFIQFLREKGIVRDLSPQEHRELRKHVETLSCSDCGEPVPLETHTACPRCHSPLSLMDPSCMENTVREAQAAAGSRQDVAPEVAAQLLQAQSKLNPFHTRAPSPEKLAAVAALATSLPKDKPSGLSWWAEDLIEIGIDIVVDTVGDLIGSLF